MIRARIKTIRDAQSERSQIQAIDEENLEYRLEVPTAALAREMLRASARAGVARRASCSGRGRQGRPRCCSPRELLLRARGLLLRSAAVLLGARAVAPGGGGVARRAGCCSGRGLLLRARGLLLRR